MCFGSTPKPNPPAPPPAALAPSAPRIGEKEKSGINKKKKGTSSLRIESQIGGTSATGTNIPKK